MLDQIKNIAQVLSQDQIKLIKGGSTDADDSVIIITDILGG